MKNILSAFCNFLNRSPTSWHAAREVAEGLAAADFTPLQETEKWPKLEPGKGYFIMRDESAVCAWRMPKKPLKSAVILASHLDSPSIKLKPIPDLHQNRLSQFSTEVYGSPLLHTWLDRDLGLAGRVLVQQKNGQVESHLVFLDDYLMTIPSLPLHLDRSVSEKGLILNRQDHLKPIISITTSKHHPATLDTLLHKHLSFETLLSFDLFLTPLQKASFIGMDNDLISAARMDNLTSVFASLHALSYAKESSETLQMAVFWDHEEVGSETKTGASSPLMRDSLERICLQQKMDREEFFCCLNRSYCASIDLAHGYNPNYSDRFDPKNAPWLGDGVVLKMSAQQKYATNATTAAHIIRLCQSKDYPLQQFASRADISSGSTVGSIMAAHDGLSTVDLGIAGWAMHSIRETISAKDQIALCQLHQALLEEP